MNPTMYQLVLLALGWATLGIAPASAQDATIDYTAVHTAHAYASTETFADLLDVIDQGTFVCTAPLDAMTLRNASNVCGVPGRMTDWGYHVEVTFPVCGPETREFRMGLDWGRGGGLFLDQAKVAGSTDNLWWNMNWNATSEILYSTATTLSTGVHQFDAIGFEDCCDGVSSLQFRVNGGTWQDATVAAMSLPDGDDDKVADACDLCPYDAANDADADGLCADVDNCPWVSNSSQIDTDLDDVGDACDDDDDNDGVPDVSDNCPLTANPDQADSDQDGAGNVCDTDDDGDGVIDAYDLCVDTEAGAFVNADGCSVADLCPCESGWKNHGAYVSCVAHSAEDLLDASIIDEAEKDAIVSAAGQSSCGGKP